MECGHKCKLQTEEQRHACVCSCCTIESAQHPPVRGKRTALAIVYVCVCTHVCQMHTITYVCLVYKGGVGGLAGIVKVGPLFGEELPFSLHFV